MEFKKLQVRYPLHFHHSPLYHEHNGTGFLSALRLLCSKPLVLFCPESLLQYGLISELSRALAARPQGMTQVTLGWKRGSSVKVERVKERTPSGDWFYQLFLLVLPILLNSVFDTVASMKTTKTQSLMDWQEIQKRYYRENVKNKEIEESWKKSSF